MAIIHRPKKASYPKRALGSLRRCAKGRSTGLPTEPGEVKKERSSLVQLGNRLADGGLLQDLLLVNASGNQGRGTDPINLSGDAAGVLEDAFHGVIAERRAGQISGNAQMVLDIVEGFLEVERRELVGIGQALAEGFVDGEVQSLVETGRSHQEQRAQRSAVHVSGEQQAELLEGSWGKEMGLVNNHQRISLFAADQVVESGADARHHLGFGKGRLVAQGGQDVAEQAVHPQGGVGQVDSQVAVGVEGGDKAADGGGFARANLSGEQANALFADQVGQTGAQLGLAAGGQDLWGGNILGKGQAGKAVELLEHFSPP